MRFSARLNLKREQYDPSHWASLGAHVCRSLMPRTLRPCSVRKMGQKAELGICTLLTTGGQFRSIPSTDIKLGHWESKQAGAHLPPVAQSAFMGVNAAYAGPPLLKPLR
jgi:hypothetical protein